MEYKDLDEHEKRWYKALWEETGGAMNVVTAKAIADTLRPTPAP